MNKPKMISKVAAFGAASVVLLAGNAQATEIRVIATGAISGAFAQLVPKFESETGHKLVISWGPSLGTSPDAIPVRLQNGEPVDVVVMVGAALDKQIKDGKFIAASRIDLAQSGIGVGVRKGAPKPDVSSLPALKQTLLNAKSIGYSEGASGNYIANILLDKLGIAEQVKKKSTLVKGKELVGQAIARGEVELGLQQISELRVVPGVDYVGPLPDELQKISTISTAIATHAPHPEAAQALTKFLTSAEASEIYTQSGLDVVSPKK